MTLEKAERAKEILDSLKVLRDVKNKFVKAEKVLIQSYDKHDIFMTFNCFPENEEGKYIKYILEGIDSDIDKLEKDLARL